jgi:hypothetical protein
MQAWVQQKSKEAKEYEEQRVHNEKMVEQLNARRLEQEALEKMEREAHIRERQQEVHLMLGIADLDAEQVS